MRHNGLVLEIRDQGLYCPSGDFFIDPVAPVERAVITHAHSDHMGGMPAILRNFRPRELWVAVDPWPHMLWFNPDTMAVPGMILINSAASRPDKEMFSTMLLFSVWLDCPESTGTGREAAATTSISVLEV